MNIGRREILIGAGGTLALTLTGGIWRVSRMPQSAMAPWDLAEPTPKDVRLDAMRYAILAPNPHNRQPWLLQLVGSDGVLIHCDLSKRLPETDPFDRQITIGFGTFIELARIAASTRGYRIDVTSFPDGAPQAPARLDERPLAYLKFVPDSVVRPDGLFAAITHRRTTRKVFDGTPSAAQLALLTTNLPGVTRAASADPAFLAPLREVTIAASMTENQTAHTWQESVDLMRIGAAEIDAQPDGLFLAGPLAEAGSSLGLLNRTALADVQSKIYQTGLDQQRELSGSLPGALWITTPGNSRSDQLSAGYAYMRTTLQAVLLGLKMQPLSQALQEYPEMAGLFGQVARLLKLGDARVQMLARIGLGPDVGPAPRWPLAVHLRG
jgi:hypothetical protein